MATAAKTTDAPAKASSKPATKPTTKPASKPSAKAPKPIDVSDRSAEIVRDVLDSVSRIQDAALSVSREWLGKLAEYVPAVPGVPADLLEAPAHLVDRGFAFAEETVGDTSTLLGDAIHRQRDFVMEVFGAVQPIVNALAKGDDEATDEG